MANYLQEAFKKLDILEEETFTTDKKGLGELRDFLDNDEVSDDVTIIDSEAETEEEIKDSYVGKVILDCSVCHSKIYEDKEDVKIDETGEWANVDMECPFCFSTDGYKVIGEVAPFEEEKSEEEEKIEIDDGEVEVEEKDEDEEKFESFKKKLHDRRANKPIKESQKSRIRKSLKESFEPMVYDTCDAGTVTIYDGYKDPDADDGYYVEINHPEKEYGQVEVECYETKEEAEDAAKKTIELIRDSYDAGELSSFYDYNTSGVLKRIARIVRQKFPGVQGVFRESKQSSKVMKPLVKESKETGEDLSEYQKWVDYDMKKYHRISGNTMKKIKSAGLSVVKDQYGDYEVIAERPVKESVEVKATDESNVEVVKNDDGSLDVKVGSTENEFTEEETIEPISDETKLEIEANSDNDEEDTMIDFDMDEFESEDFDELGESYLKRIYENVDSYETIKVSSGDNRLKLEGVITFKSGNKKKTNFVFEACEATKKNKVKFIGENQQITRGNKAFTVTGTFNEKKFLPESLNYNYRAKGADGKSKRIYGTVSKKK